MCWTNSELIPDSSLFTPDTSDASSVPVTCSLPASPTHPGFMVSPASTWRGHSPATPLWCLTSGFCAMSNYPSLAPQGADYPMAVSLKNPGNILALTYWDYRDALIQTYTLPYLRMIRKHQ